MKTIFEDKTYHVLFDEEKMMIILDWFTNTEKWTSDDFVKENLNIVKLVEQYQPTYLLSLSTNFFYPIRPEEQIWLVENVFLPHSQNGVRKMALIMSEDFISQLAIEQLINETNVVPSGMFASREEAEQWLFKV